MYGLRKKGKKHGVVMTKIEVVCTMLDLVGYTTDKDLSAIKIIEPAAGNGVFVFEILKRLHTSSLNFCFNFADALSNVKLFEIDTESASRLSKLIDGYLSSISSSHASLAVTAGDYLLSEKIKADVIVANPPYVRYDNIPNEARSIYKKRFKTFTHRADIYIPFFEKSLSELNPDGKLCYICSNRWLKNQYGQKLRSLIGQAYQLEKIINLETLSPFEEEVIAYPAIFLASNSQSEVSETSYYEVANFANFTSSNFSVDNPTALIKTTSPKGAWFVHNTFSNETSSNHLSKIEDQGFKIGIGVATGCDEIFIGKTFHGVVEPELLVPILKSSDLRGNTFSWSGNFIINPFNPDGSIIDLAKYPLTKAYFDSHAEKLKMRHTARTNPSKWYKTIDRITPEITFKPKILLPDISGNTHIFIDKGEYYPHHNLYYIVGSDTENLTILAAILMSNLVREQLATVGNKMNGGYPRWQSQNLKKIRIPYIKAMSSNLRASLTNAYHNGNADEINSLLNSENFTDYKIQEEQLTLFEKKEKYLTKKASPPTV